jgi:hypothetical protein
MLTLDHEPACSSDGIYPLTVLAIMGLGKLLATVFIPRARRATTYVIHLALEISPSSQGIPQSQQPSRPLRGLPVLPIPPRPAKTGAARTTEQQNAAPAGRILSTWSNPHLRASGLQPQQHLQRLSNCFCFSLRASPLQRIALLSATPQGSTLKSDWMVWTGRGGRASSVPAMKLLNVNARSFTALPLKSYKA